MLSHHATTLEALVIRELMSRFGRHDLGFAWAILEPMILTVGVLVIWTLLHGSEIRGIQVLSFIATGYMMLTVWRHVTGSMTRVMQQHATLLYHQPITHFDIVLARLLLELLAATTALMIVGFVLIATGLVKPVADWGLTLLGWMLVCGYFGSFSLVIAGLSQLWEKSEKFVQPLNYFMLPISGVFFMVDWLPSWAQDIVLWNPSVNCIEIFRAGVLGPSIRPHYDTCYVVGIIATMTLLGLLFVRFSRRHIEV